MGSIDEEERPTACVGICYYNKLMALEAKEDLASHNLVYKNQVTVWLSHSVCGVVDMELKSCKLSETWSTPFPLMGVERFAI